MLHSSYRKLVPVQLPYAGRRHYMHGFDLADPVMLHGYEDYEAPVRALCAAAGATTGTAYMTVDERLVAAGSAQRKPGPHVDGCFTGLSWEHRPSWNHYCNSVPIPRMAVIVAASVAGCRVWEGEFDGAPGPQGCLAHLELDEGLLLPANVGFLLSPDCVHQSEIMSVDTHRTFLRIALPISTERDSG